MFTVTLLASAAGGLFGAGTAGDPFNNFSSSVQALGGFFFNTDVNGALLANQSIIVTATDGTGAVSRTLTKATTSTFLGVVASGADSGLPR